MPKSANFTGLVSDDARSRFLALLRAEMRARQHAYETPSEQESYSMGWARRRWHPYKALTSTPGAYLQGWLDAAEYEAVIEYDAEPLPWAIPRPYDARLHA